MPRNNNASSSPAYRKRAEECVEAAQTARPIDRPMFLRMASAWLALSDQAKAEHDTLADNETYGTAGSPG